MWFCLITRSVLGGARSTWLVQTPSQIQDGTSPCMVGVLGSGWDRLGIEEISWESAGNILGIGVLSAKDRKCGFWDLRDCVCPSPCLYDPKRCTTLLAKTLQFFATYFRAHRYCRAGLLLSLDHCI